MSIQDVIKRDRDESSVKEPWCCPKCSYTLAPWQRIHDGTCPGCGAQIRKPVRRIRMENGKLKAVSVHKQKKVLQVTDQQMWDKCRYMAHYSGRTLNFARAMFNKQTGRWPNNLKNCPQGAHHPDWALTPSQAYPFMNRQRAKSH